MWASATRSAALISHWKLRRKLLISFPPTKYLHCTQKWNKIVAIIFNSEKSSLEDYLFSRTVEQRIEIVAKYFQLLAPSKTTSCSHSKFLLLLQSFYGAQFLSEAMTPKSGDYNPFSHRIVVKSQKLKVGWWNSEEASSMPFKFLYEWTKRDPVFYAEGWTNKSNTAKLSLLLFSQLSSVLSSVHRDIYPSIL